MEDYVASVAWMYLDTLRQVIGRVITKSDVLDDMEIVPNEESVYAAIIREQGLTRYEEAEQDIFGTVLDIIGA